MQSMYFLIPISLFLFVVGIFAVYYAVRSRQFDDLDNEAQRVVLDDRQLRRQQLSDISQNRPSTHNHAQGIKTNDE